MERRVTNRILGCLAGVFSLGSTILAAAFASNLVEVPALSALCVFLYIAFGLNILGIAVLLFFCAVHIRSLDRQILPSKWVTWSIISGGVAIAAVSTIVAGVALVWLVMRRDDAPAEIWRQQTITMIGIWFAIWGLSVIFQISFFVLLGMWTKNTLKRQSVARLNLDFGVRTHSMSEIRPNTHHTNPSFSSQDITLHSEPRTPTSRKGSLAGRSSVTKGGPGSSKTRLARGSARSSFDHVAFPAGEMKTVSMDATFDNWDTSAVHHELRKVLHSSPPATRAGLETIPGSRPESPADALDGPFLPESPIAYSGSPHATSSETPTAVGWNPSSMTHQSPSSTPSSPPNFSRPTSSSYNKVSPLRVGPEVFEFSMHELIHPLFRPDSPHPPPITTPGTMVTASPMANQPITPRTLARLRSNSQPGQWKTMPKIDTQSETRSVHTARSDHDSAPPSPTVGSPSIGSPGPSIVDESELPPILPGFVLSAGARSSLVGYGKRKSVKKERTQSQGSRLSGFL